MKTKKKRNLCMADATSGVRSFHTARSPGAGPTCGAETIGTSTTVSTNGPRSMHTHSSAALGVSIPPAAAMEIF